MADTTTSQTSAYPSSKLYRIASMIPVSKRYLVPKDSQNARQALTQTNLEALQSSNTSDSSSTMSLSRNPTRCPSPEPMAVVPFEPQTVDCRKVFLDTALRLGGTARYLLQQPDTKSQACGRASLIDAARYMNMALPQLDARERYALQESLPMSHVETATAPNQLRRGVARLAAIALAMFAIFIPLVVTLFNMALRYERDHRLTEHVIAAAERGVNSLGGYGSTLQTSRVFEMARYICEGVGGGVVDGFRDYKGGQRGR